MFVCPDRSCSEGSGECESDEKMSSECESDEKVSKLSQCDILSIDVIEIERMTINAIRTEISTFDGGTDGCKRELAARLSRLRERYNREQEL